ncbi:hypothetical protein F5B22DRAFT_610257 [Xylaria bambusicola]|uniref:uncharacterized protein n=1 Tax=Xylaria bambusicola TaxID=326684 RepID=UPI002007FE58|nr:uncharacterized protein F5B22DRAFT_610257 [Xylaria bambusicola]KAI0514650.1 hypothetical protein F5B22DRAFT_610257 [Xylaria bambusicola]
MLAELTMNIMSTSLSFMVFQTTCFIIAWLAIGRHVSRNGPIPGARTLNKVHSCLYSAISAILLYLALSPNHDEIARTFYHLSKFYEYIDVLTVRAGGSSIDLHFGFHHLTTPYLTFFRVLRSSEGWQTFAALNTAHHALMYAYFGGASFLRPLLDFTGCVQLIVGVAAEVYVVWSNGEDGVQVWPHVFAAVLLSSYFILWVREMRMRRVIRGQAGTKAEDGFYRYFLFYLW